MENLSYKCPYCLNEYNQSEFAITQINNLIDEIRCPNENCQKVLPLNFLEGKSKIISIVGGINVGKTYYSLALLYLFLNSRQLHRFGISGTIVGSEQLKLQIEQMFKSFGKERLLNTRFNEAKETIILQVTISRSKKNEYIYLSFFDNPGDGFSDITRIVNGMPNVYKSDALFFLFEPSQIPTLRTHSGYSERFEEREIDNVYNVLHNTIEILLHTNKKRSQNSKKSILSVFKPVEKIKEPMAICISKFDQVEELFFNQLPRDNEELDITVFSNHKLKFDIIEAYSKEIEQTLFDEEKGDFRLKLLIENNLSTYKYFGVQSITNEFNLSPKGAILPILWLFKELNLIK